MSKVNKYIACYSIDSTSGEVVIHCSCDVSVFVATRLLFDYFTRYLDKNKLFVTSVSSPLNLLDDSRYHHFGLIGGKANVFMFHPRYLRRFYGLHIHKSLISVSNESLFPHPFGYAENDMACHIFSDCLSHSDTIDL